MKRLGLHRSRGLREGARPGPACGRFPLRRLARCVENRSDEITRQGRGASNKRALQNFYPDADAVRGSRRLPLSGQFAGAEAREALTDIPWDSKEDRLMPVRVGRPPTRSMDGTRDGDLPGIVAGVPDAASTGRRRTRTAQVPPAPAQQIHPRAPITANTRFASGWLPRLRDLDDWERFRGFPTRRSRRCPRIPSGQVTRREGYGNLPLHACLFRTEPLPLFTFGGLLDKRMMRDPIMAVWTTVSGNRRRMGYDHPPFMRWAGSLPFYDKQRPNCLPGNAGRQSDTRSEGIMNPGVRIVRDKRCWECACPNALSQRLRGRNCL